jgi:hypothetical protein
MELCIDTSGCVRFVYSEAVDLSSLGPPTIRRASSVEPDATGQSRTAVRHLDFQLADIGRCDRPTRGPDWDRLTDDPISSHDKGTAGVWALR